MGKCRFKCSVVTEIGRFTARFGAVIMQNVLTVVVYGHVTAELYRRRDILIEIIIRIGTQHGLFAHSRRSGKRHRHLMSLCLQ